MPSISDDHVRHIAKLARLTLTEEEVKKFTKELAAILTYVEQLQKIDTHEVEATAQVTGLTNSFREDRVLPSGITPDAILSTSPLPIIEHQIQTPSAHG